MKIKKIVIILFILLVFLLVGKGIKNRKAEQSQLASTNTSTTVPSQFSNTYTNLDKSLSDFDSYLDTDISIKNASVIYGAELLPANGNRGEDLLKPNGMEGSIIYLDKLTSLGIKGVTIFMPFPILSSSYSHSNDYWNFYKNLTQEIKNRKLKIHIKTGPVFTEKEISSLNIDYSDISLEEYFAGRKEIAVRIAQEIQPDYLTISNEPATEISILKKGTISDKRRIQFITETLNAIGNTQTLVGAGSGTWENLSYIENLAKNTKLDYIDLHIYPVASRSENYLVKSVEMIDTAKKYNKKVIIGEFWLYKAAAQELTSTPTHIKMFGRDTYSFWSPLDQKMLKIISELAQNKQIEYISPFWTKYFFGYLDYDSNKLKSPGQLLRLADKEAVQNILSNRFTPTGETYKNIIRDN